MSVTDNMVCRACLSTTSAHFYSFDEEIPNANLNILKMLKLCKLKITQCDSIPNRMCLQCFITLEKLVHFVQKYEKTQILLAERAQKENVQIEPEEEIVIICTNPDEWDLSDPEENSTNQAEVEETLSRIPENDVISKSSSGIQFLPCPSCGLVLSKYRLSLHVERMHQGLEMACKCHICEIDLLTITSYKLHYATNHNTTKRHPCLHCKKTFSLEQNLRAHIREVHKDPKLHPCDQCDETFSNSGRLRYHKIKVHEGARYLCPHCGNAYLQLQHLKDHIWVHTGIRPFHCDTCGSQFGSSRLLKSHMLRH